MVFSCSKLGLHRSQADFPAQLEVRVGVYVCVGNKDACLFLRALLLTWYATQDQSRSKRRRQGSDQENARSTPFLCCSWQSHCIFRSIRFHTSLENLHTWLSQQVFWSPFFPVKSFAQESDASHIYVLNLKSYVFSQSCFSNTPISYYCELNISEHLRSSRKHLEIILRTSIEHMWTPECILRTSGTTWVHLRSSENVSRTS